MRLRPAPSLITCNEGGRKGDLSLGEPFKGSSEAGTTMQRLTLACSSAIWFLHYQHTTATTSILLQRRKMQQRKIQRRNDSNRAETDSRSKSNKSMVSAQGGWVSECTTEDIFIGKLWITQCTQTGIDGVSSMCLHTHARFHSFTQEGGIV